MPNDLEEEIARRVEAIVEWCYQVAKQAVSPVSIEEDAEKWWRGHYRVLFHYAMCVKHRLWEEDGPNVLKATAVVAQAAAKAAGSGNPIKKQHAQTASKEHDCSSLGVDPKDICCEL